MAANARENLIFILQNAHAGELAAAFAYRGHWKSLKDSPEKEQIKQIETEELQHRAGVLDWLEELNAKPRRFREAVFWAIGRTLGVSCYISGWFVPMYLAGRLECQNVREYLDAANFAKELGFDECAADLLKMSAAEQRHEDFFKEIVQDHFLLPATKFFFGWG